jgi:hypothetical protein
MKTKELLCIIVAIVALYVIFTRNEKFQYADVLPEGMYLIKQGDSSLVPRAFTPVTCGYGQFDPAPSMESSWVLKRVTPGIYMIQKPGKSECLYTNTDGTVRSYIFSQGCDRTNLCGADTLNEKGQLDQYSVRSYWKLAKGPNDSIIMQSMQNNFYVAMKNGAIVMQPNLDASCYFTFSKVQ